MLNKCNIITIRLYLVRVKNTITNMCKANEKASEEDSQWKARKRLKRESHTRARPLLEDDKTSQTYIRVFFDNLFCCHVCIIMSSLKVLLFTDEAKLYTYYVIGSYKIFHLHLL